jgi:two-component system invasion response regulator UvrY
VEKAASGQWDIIVSDLAMPGGGGLEALRKIREMAINCPVLILSIYPEEQYAARVIKAGAAAYLNKDAAPEELVATINRILSVRKSQGDTGGSDAIAELQTRRKKDAPLHELLSDREWDVFMFIANGKTTSEICNLLSLRSTTVSTYRARILIKMQMRTNADIIQYAVHHKLI